MGVQYLVPVLDITDPTPDPSPTREGSAYGVPSAEDGGSRSPPLQGRGGPTEFLPQRMAAAAPLPSREGSAYGVPSAKDGGSRSPPL